MLPRHLTNCEKKSGSETLSISLDRNVPSEPNAPHMRHPSPLLACNRVKIKQADNLLPRSVREAL